MARHRKHRNEPVAAPAQQKSFKKINPDAAGIDCKSDERLRRGSRRPRPAAGAPLRRLHRRSHRTGRVAPSLRRLNSLRSHPNEDVSEWADMICDALGMRKTF
jgi:hypothetical protein